MKNKVFFLFLALTLLLLWSQCKHEPALVESLPEGASKIEPTAQRTGDAAAGRNYLLQGDYINYGIPLAVYKLVFNANNTDDLGRAGDNKGIIYNFTVSTNPNGVKVAATNCLSCHADKLNGQVIIGLGNTTADNTQDVASIFNSVDLVVRNLYTENSDEWRAYFPLSRGFKTIAPFIKTETRGINPADKIFAALSAHREAQSLKWLTTAQFPIPVRVVPTDVPAWWLMRKKNALYYNALGVGDFGRLSAASSLVAMADSAEARRIDAKFADVMAFLRSLRPPQYAGLIDQNLVTKGKALFELHCEKCHGRYGANESYPNLLIDQKVVGTDAALVNEYREYPEYNMWYNRSWYNQKPSAAQLLPTKGYIAPPLDGIWATAPYLHNGSVPTLDDLLNSTQRPAKWSRTFDNTADFDPVKVGWRYKIETVKGANINVYDTSLYGYGNGGHTYGDKLTTDERKALIEYLKTL
jgi:mono/diheme cytochrome c family protein